MVNLDTLKDLFEHMCWADSAVWKAVYDHSPAFEDARLQETLYHYHATQRAFLMIWRGESFGDTFPKFSDARSLMEWAIGYYGEALDYLSVVGNEKLGGQVTLPWSEMIEARLGRPAESTTFGETALQVALHSTYHRGQVNARLREIGGEPPLVDYIAWLWQGRPSAEWP